MDSDNVSSASVPRHRRRWWLAGILAGCAVLGTVGWWLAGKTVWTDGRSIRFGSGEAKVRKVIWTIPEPVGFDLNTPEQEYEPALSPDGVELYFVRGKAGKGSGTGADIFTSR